EALAVGLHQPDGGMREMHRHYERAGTGDRGEETSARARGFLAVPVEDGRPARLAALQRMVHEVADEHRALSARSDIDATVAGRVARGRDERERIVERKIVVDQQRLAGRDHRLAVEAPHVAGRVVAALGRLLPGGVFALVKDVFRLWKGRYPAAIAQHGIPAAVIDVQMRAEHVVDALERQPRGAEAIEPRLLGEVHGRRMSLILAGAGIDQDGALWRAHHEGL